MAPQNPIRRLLTPNEKKAPVLTPKQFKNLLRLAGGNRQAARDISIIWHSFGSALRVSEIAKLKVRNVVDKTGAIMDLGHLPAAAAKNGKARKFLQLEEEQRVAIRAYMDYRLRRRLRVTDKEEYDGLDPNSPFYLGRGAAGFAISHKEYTKADGTVEQYEVCGSMQQLLTKMLRGVGVIDGSSHSGRRTLATRLNDRGVPLETIARILGHTDVQMTLEYIEPNRKRIREAHRRIYAGVK